MAHKVVLVWQASADASVPGFAGYNIYRSTTPGAEAAPALNAAPVTDLTYTDTTVSVGQAYDYVVTAVVNGIESVFSNEVISTVLLPAAPTGLTITEVS